MSYFINKFDTLVQCSANFFGGDSNKKIKNSRHIFILFRKKALVVNAMDELGFVDKLNLIVVQYLLNKLAVRHLTSTYVLLMNILLHSPTNIYNINQS